MSLPRLVSGLKAMQPVAVQYMTACILCSTFSTLRAGSLYADLRACTRADYKQFFGAFVVQIFHWCGTRLRGVILGEIAIFICLRRVRESCD